MHFGIRNSIVVLVCKDVWKHDFHNGVKGRQNSVYSNVIYTPPYYAGGALKFIIIYIIFIKSIIPPWNLRHIDRAQAREEKPDLYI